MNITYVPDFDLDGEVVGFYSLSTDITDLHQAQEALAHSQKMEAVGRLTGGVAHDFNNVLMAVIANLEMLEDDLGPGDERVQLARAAIGAARRGADVISRLLAFARKQTLDPAAIDLLDLSASLGTLLTSSMGGAVKVTTRISEPLSPAFADQGHLQNALLNLAVNAADAMPHGGKLEIEMADVRLDEARLAGNEVARPGDFVMIAVSDTGSGIAAELMDRIFDPFFTTKGMATNSGLGMSMVQGFVQQSQGHLEIESEVGVGTLVRIFLPCAEASKEAPAKPADRPQAQLGGSETILLVEDDQAVRNTLAQTLGRLGYSVAVAEDGPAALAVLAAQPVDAVVTDQIMPHGMTGLELARQAAKDYPGLGFVLITGYADALKAAADDGEGKYQMLSKPFGQASLAAAVRSALGGRPAG